MGEDTKRNLMNKIAGSAKLFAVQLVIEQALEAIQFA